MNKLTATKAQEEFGKILVAIDRIERNLRKLEKRNKQLIAALEFWRTRALKRKSKSRG